MAIAQPEVASIIANWPEKPREVAETIIAKYGQPDEGTDSLLIWHARGPWKETIIHRDEVPHRFPMPHTDLLEQSIDYRVPPEKCDDLALFDGSVIVERTKGELHARCDKEEANFLALNLANDIVTGRRSVQEARETYAEAIKSMMEGQPGAYVQDLQFTVQQGATADPDQNVMQQT